MAKGGTTPVICKIESFEPDPLQYKPGKPHICPINLFVQVDVPNEFFQATIPSGLPSGAKCLTMKGFHHLRRVLHGLER